MPPLRTFIAGGSSTYSQFTPLEDDDDICPVCDGDCTCRSRAGPSTSQPTVPYPLKIKLTVPPSLRFRKYSSSDDDDKHIVVRPRKMSVGPASDVVNVDADNRDTSEDEGADDEDDGNEEDDEAETETEDEGHSFTQVDDNDAPIPDDTDGKLGVSFGGVATGWSEDEESSFDADVFFAALDSDSDSCPSPTALKNGAFASDSESDVNTSFSADEEDALLLMNVDPSVHIRRMAGEFEVGVELDGLSFGWDGQLVLPPRLSDVNTLDLELYNGSTESDIDMTSSDSGTSTEDQEREWSGLDALVLEETDGETTEDELVDSDGLPNPRAMMLFRWPPAVSAIDPASTMSPSSPTPAHILANTSHTTRIALASISTQRGSPAPSPADILAGKVSMDDLDDIEIHDNRLLQGAPSSSRSSRYAPGVPTMGQFVTDLGSSHRRAIIDGYSQTAPSPFPSSRILRVRQHSALSYTSTDSHEMSADAESHERESQSNRVSAKSQPSSSDDVTSHSQPPTSEDPSSTEAIDLDDVLDASFMDSDPMMSEPETPIQHTWTEPPSLNRWDRIPVATFRRIRETPLLEGTTSDTSLGSRYTGMGTFVHNDMLGTPKIRGGKAAKGSSRRSKGKNNMLVISPVLLPVRDGERTPTHGSPSSYSPSHHQNRHRHEKSRKELRKEKAMMKRKMVSKNVYPTPRQHHHRHHPNTKTRGTNSMQRTHSSSSHVPRLSL